MNTSNRPLKRIVSAIALSIAIPAGCDSSGTGTSAETHFVSCSSDADCAGLEGNYSCIEQHCLPLGDASVGCVPGSQVACACPGGSSGIQVCSTNGTAYEPCTGCSVSGTGGSATGGVTSSGGSGTDASAGGRADGPTDSGASTGGSTGGASSSTGGSATSSGGSPTSTGGSTSDGGPAGSGGVAAGGAAATGGVAGATGGSPSNGGASGSGGSTSDSGPTGVPVVLASGQNNPFRIAVDAQNVYWANRSDGAIMKVAINGGVRIPLASGSTDYLAIDDTSVYYTAPSEIMKVPKGGGTPVPVATGQNGPAAIAVDASNVYWLNLNSFSCSGANCTPTHVMKASKTPVEGGVDGGGPVILATLSVPPFSLVVDGTNVYWTNNGGLVTTYAVSKVAVNGGTPVPVALLTGRTRGNTIVVDPANVYWTDVNVFSTPSTSSLMRAPIGGGAATTLSHDSATGVVHDGTHLYWIGTGGVIKKASPDGKITTHLATSPGVGRLAVDATSVYWTNQTDGTVMRVTPK